MGYLIGGLIFAFGLVLVIAGYEGSTGALFQTLVGQKLSLDSASTSTTAGTSSTSPGIASTAATAAAGSASATAGKTA